jgi:hypothetical protein
MYLGRCDTIYIYLGRYVRHGILFLSRLEMIHVSNIFYQLQCTEIVPVPYTKKRFLRARNDS